MRERQKCKLSNSDAHILLATQHIKVRHHKGEAVVVVVVVVVEVVVVGRRGHVEKEKNRGVVASSPVIRLAALINILFPFEQQVIFVFTG